MQTTLTIECDIRDAQAVLYEASKIIDKRNEAGRQSDLGDVYFPANAKKLEDLKWKPPAAPVDFTVVGQSSMEPAEVMCSHCDWTGYIIELKIDGNKYMRCPKCYGFIIRDVDVTKKGVV